MIKKVLATLAFVVSASFAEWDYYPVPQNTTASARINSTMRVFADFSDSPANESHISNHTIDFRYIFFNSLELSIEGLGVHLYKDGGLLNVEGDLDKEFLDPSLGVRYQIIPMLSLFADVGLPISHLSDISDNWSTDIGALFGKVYENPNIISKYGVLAKSIFSYDVFEFLASGEIGINIVNNGLDLLLGTSIGKIIAMNENDFVEYAKYGVATWLGFEASLNKTFSLSGTFSFSASKFKKEFAYTGKAGLSAQFNF